MSARTHNTANISISVDAWFQGWHLIFRTSSDHRYFHHLDSIIAFNHSDIQSYAIINGFVSYFYFWNIFIGDTNLASNWITWITSSRSFIIARREPARSKLFVATIILIRLRSNHVFIILFIIKAGYKKFMSKFTISAWVNSSFIVSDKFCNMKPHFRSLLISASDSAKGYAAFVISLHAEICILRFHIADHYVLHF